MSEKRDEFEHAIDLIVDAAFMAEKIVGPHFREKSSGFAKAKENLRRRRGIPKAEVREMLSIAFAAGCNFLGDNIREAITVGKMGTGSITETAADLILKEYEDAHR